MIVNKEEFSVTYPIATLLGRAGQKVKLMDRNIPMTSDVWGGGMANLVQRFVKLSKWGEDGVTQVKVFYHPIYFSEKAPNFLDPLSLKGALRYAGIKE